MKITPNAPRQRALTPVTVASPAHRPATDSLPPTETGEDVQRPNKNFLRSCLCQVDTVSRLPSETRSKGCSVSASAQTVLRTAGSRTNVWRSCFGESTVSRMSVDDGGPSGVLTGGAHVSNCLCCVEMSRVREEDDAAILTRTYSDGEGKRKMRGCWEKANSAMKGGWTRVKGMSRSLKRDH